MGRTGWISIAGLIMAFFMIISATGWAMRIMGLLCFSIVFGVNLWLRLKT